MRSTARTVLVTGAFGNLGRSLVRRLVGDGWQVRAFDLPTAANRRAAQRLPAAAVPCLGDLTRALDVEGAVAGVDAIVHLAAILPPLAERHPELARAVNVEATRILIDAAVAQRGDLPFVFASSCSVYGPEQAARGVARGDSPTQATDVYTQTKLAAESMVRASPLGWVILRLGAAIEGSAAATDPIVLRLMFEIDPDNPIEVVHGEDVARAAARALLVPAVQRRILPIGGGDSCRLTQHQLLEASLAALGVGGIPGRAFGSAPYYTCWLDSSEAQELLGYQQHDFDQIRAALAARFGLARPLLRPLAPLLRHGLLRLSGPYRGAPSRPTWRALMEAGY